MARRTRKREVHRASVVESDAGGHRAEILLTVGSIDVESGPLTHLQRLRRWFAPAAGYRSGELADVDDVGDDVSIVLDDVAFALYIGGLGGELVGTHDGIDFTDAARSGTVDVYVADLDDVRRARAADIEAAAADGRLLGGSVRAFVVHSLDR